MGRRLLKNTLQTVGGRLAVMLVWIAFTPAILRSLGTERFAIWSLFYALTGYLGALDFGLAQGTLRGVAAARGRGDVGAFGDFVSLGIVGYGVLALLWTAASLAASSALVAWLRIPGALEGLARFAILLGALTFVASGVANVTMAAAQGVGRFDLANGVLLSMAAAQAAGAALVLWGGWGLEALLVTVTAGWLVGGIAGVSFLGRAMPGFRWSGLGRSLRRLGEVSSFGVPLQATSALAAANLQMDKVLLARLANLAAVTPYELGARVAVTAGSLPQLLLLPIMREAAMLSGSNAGNRLRELFDRASRYYLSAVAVLVAPLLAGADRLFAVWLGSPQAEPARVLTWLAAATAVGLGTGLASAVARGMARTDLELSFAVTTVALHLVASLLWIPLMGLRGAMVSGFVSQLAGALVFMILFARVTGWPLVAVVLRPWLEPILAVAAGWAVAAAVNRVLPVASGVAGLPSLVCVGLVASLVALAVVIGTRYFPWNEALGLLTPRRVA